MGIESVREGNQCERCKRDASNVGELTFYKEDDILCCKECHDKVTEENNQRCDECHSVMGKKVRVTRFHKVLCQSCVEKTTKKKIETDKQKSFIKTAWFKWIMVAFAIMGLAATLFI